MKTLFIIFAVLVVIGFSDLNPLLMWPPYYEWVNMIMLTAPRLYFGAFLSILTVVLIAAHFGKT